ncbi:MAG: Asp-tRNA(Asn)/Glu-tRNA(Gln) amidotransferase subunit GatA [Myxococcales bacterium]|nr:Asp-tRNA(Asn)/Glu-tRNA(Gln) amidotransferase subunit GatA [Myxococcales bacterium]
MHLVDLAERVRDGSLSAVGLAERALARAAARADLGAVLEPGRERALEAARRVDDKRARGERLGRLAGVPIAIKDALCTRGVTTTAGSKILEGWVPPYDAHVVERLEAEDAVVCLKTNMDELAMGSSNENSAYGLVKNPWDTARAPGGSSGGSAAAVAARLVVGALGSDTGGSVRQPAAFTGVVGVKPTYGRVSRFGLIAFASSLDQVGPMATDVRGAARLLAAIAGHDPRDSTSLDAPVDDYEAACERPMQNTRVGVPAEYFGDGLDADVRASVERALARLVEAGATLVPIELPHTRHAVATYYVVATAEASSNLSRFDGVRYGQRRTRGRGTLADMYGATRDVGFGREVKRRILLGTFVLSAGYYDAYYGKAQAVRALVRRDFERAFERVDVIASPTAPTAAFALGEKTHDPLAMYLGDVYTLPASLAGLPALSVPVEPTPSGLPVGLQLVGPRLGEPALFTVAAACERAAGQRDRLAPHAEAGPWT